MDPGSFQSLNCIACGRNFAQPNAFSNHVRTCRLQKKRRASALEAAKEIYRNKKIRLAANETETFQIESQVTNAVAGGAIEVSVHFRRGQYNYQFIVYLEDR